jgi:hypothetical protein
MITIYRWSTSTRPCWRGPTGRAVSTFARTVEDFVTARGLD